MRLNVIILAAGQGTRMKSQLPKVLHTVAGRPLLEHVYNAAIALPKARIHVVYGQGGKQVLERFKHLKVTWVKQAPLLGSGHAVMQALPYVKPHDMALILYGDVPLITTTTLQTLITAAEEHGMGLLTVELSDPSGYGRIVRDEHGRVMRIVEHKDATVDERAIREVNTGMMAVSGEKLDAWVSRLTNRNAQREYYLTDIIAMAVNEGVEVQTVAPSSAFEVMGINDRVQLAEVERYYQLVQAHHLMREGVTLADPARFDLRGDLEIGQDVSMDINVVLEGSIKIGNNVSIGAHCMLRNVSIADEAQILSHCVIEDAVIGKGAKIGPFARVRPGTQLAEGVQVGNFVEIKKARVGRRSKINHLSYVGDSEVGRDCNIGAGTITCNYDGANKHKTIIGDDVFIGSDTQLVAPVKVGNGATLGAGTTLTQDAPAKQLTLSRVAQKSMRDWKRPKKRK